ncbi:MAG: hypothetical protein AAGU14_04450 [Eubacteriaceae bacterium]
MDSILNSLNDIVNILEKLTQHNLFDYFAYIIIPALAITLPIIFINRNTNKQIANQNKETYRPRLKFVEFKTTNYEERVYKFYCSSFKCERDQDISNDYTVFCDITLKNIGNGLAHDITFYSLHDGESCGKAQQIIENVPQTYSSTEEIEKNGNGTFHFSMSFNPKIVEYHDSDFCLLLCNYKDLNGNNYKLLIGCILKKIKRKDIWDENDFIKNDGIFDTYYYQEGTKQFDNRIDYYKKQYSKILNEIENIK